MILLLFFLTFYNSFSKDFKVINSETEQGISLVSIFIVDSDDEKLKGKYLFTNEKGFFRLNNGFNYELLIQHNAFDELTLKINNENDLNLVKLNPKTYYVEEIVTTGQIRPQSRQKSVFQISVIDEENLNSRAAPTLREVLINETNMNVNKDGILGSNLSMNGIGGENVKIMIDGVPVVGRENGSFNLDQINVKNAERIEIIQGPMSAIYGSDALGGVINIITKQHSSDFNLKFDPYYENVGIYNLNLSSDFKINANNFSINLSRNLFQGFSPTNTFRAQVWDPRIQYFGDLKYNRKFKDIDFVYSLNYMNDFILNRSEPIDAPYNENAFDDEYITNRYINTINVIGKIDTNRFYNIIGNFSFYNRETDRYLKNLVTLERNKTQDINDQKFNDFFTLMSRGTYSHDEFFHKYSYQMGYEMKYDKSAGDKINNIDNDIFDAALFFTSEYLPFKNFIINPMFRFIYNSKFSAPIIPVLNLKYNINENIGVRTSYAKGFRAPSIKELNLEFIDQNHYIIGNSKLEAENSYTLNFSLDYNLASLKHVIETNLKYYYNNISNQISLINVGFEESVQQQIFSYSNIDKFKSQGIQFNLSYYRNNISNKLSFNYLGVWTSILDEYNFSPEFSYNLNYNIESFDLRLAIFYKYTGSIVRFGYVGEILDDTEINQEDLRKIKIDSFSNFDLNITKYLFNKSLSLSLGIKNLLDVTNINTVGNLNSNVHDSNTGSLPINWGRTIFLNLSYTYN